MGRLEPEGFKPEYEGDTPNRQWVRKRLASKGTPTDLTGVVKVLPDAHILWIFNGIIKHSFFGIKDD